MPLAENLLFFQLDVIVDSYHRDRSSIILIKTPAEYPKTA